MNQQINQQTNLHDHNTSWRSYKYVCVCAVNFIRIRYETVQSWHAFCIRSRCNYCLPCCSQFVPSCLEVCDFLGRFLPVALLRAAKKHLFAFYN